MFLRELGNTRQPGNYGRPSISQRTNRLAVLGWWCTTVSREALVSRAHPLASQKRPPWGTSEPPIRLPIPLFPTALHPNHPIHSRKSVELVRYRPGEAIRWLETGGDNIRRGARNRGINLLRTGTIDSQTIGDNLKTAAGALFDFGKGTYAEMMHRLAEDSEYVLQENQFDIVNGGNIRSIAYSRIVAMTIRGDRATLTLDKGTATIKPFAFIVVGRIRVPVGWVRNGIEVPFEMLVHELAARSGCELQEE